MSEAAPNDLPIAVPPALDYAAPDADGTPAFVPEVEAAIDRGARLAPLTRLFARREWVGRYLVKSIARRFALDADASAARCECCAVETEQVVRLRWTFRVPERFASWRLSSSDDHAVAQTFHPLCARCFADWSARTRPSRRVQAAMAWIYVPCVAGILAIWIASAWHRFDARWISALLAAAVLAAGVGRIGGWFERRRLPKPIRTRVPRWLAFAEIIRHATRRELAAPMPLDDNDD